MADEAGVNTPVDDADDAAVAELTDATRAANASPPREGISNVERPNR